LFLFFALQQCFSEQRGCGEAYAPQQLVSLLQVLTVFCKSPENTGDVFRLHGHSDLNPAVAPYFSQECIMEAQYKAGSSEPGRAQTCWL